MNHSMNKKHKNSTRQCMDCLLLYSLERDKIRMTTEITRWEILNGKRVTTWIFLLILNWRRTVRIASLLTLFYVILLFAIINFKMSMPSHPVSSSNWKRRKKKEISHSWSVLKTIALMFKVMKCCGARGYHNIGEAMHSKNDVQHDPNEK